jgi:hypothetical protein
MKMILIFTMLFLAAIGTHAQSEISGAPNSTLFQNNKLKLAFSDTKQTQNVVLFENIGKIIHADSVNIKIVPGSTVRAEEIVYIMTIKELESDSRMPVYVPNPEIHYTILDKKLGGFVIDPRKD